MPEVPPVFPRMRQYCFDLASVTVTPETVSAFDCVLVATNHDVFDYQMIQEHAHLIVDSRGVYQAPAKNVVKA